MGNKQDKRKLALLEEQQRADRARMDQMMTTAATPKPVETAVENQQLDWINATSGKNGPVDVTKLPGMGASYGLYQGAAQRQAGERMGLGALQLGAQGSNPNLAALLREQSDNQRQQEAAGGLEQAYRMKDAEMRGSLLPLLSLQQNRSMGLAGMAGNQSMNSTSQYANFRPAPSIWQQMLLSGISGASQIGAAFAGKP